MIRPACHESGPILGFVWPRIIRLSFDRDLPGSVSAGAGLAAPPDETARDPITFLVL